MQSVLWKSAGLSVIRYGDRSARADRRARPGVPVAPHGGGQATDFLERRVEGGLAGKAGCKREVEQRARIVARFAHQSLHFCNPQAIDIIEETQPQYVVEIL